MMGPLVSYLFVRERVGEREELHERAHDVATRRYARLWCDTVWNATRYVFSESLSVTS